MTAQDIVNKLYGVNTMEELPEATSVGSTPVRIFGNNPGALQLTFINLGSTDGYLWTTPDVSASKGILIAANGGSYEIDITRFMTLPTSEWWFVVATGTTNVYGKRMQII